MISSSTTWRPRPIVRPVAIGIVRRGEQILVVAVRDDSGAVTGWRPLGGTIEFGERAVDALAREFLEELGASIEVVRLVSVLESLYTHHETTGHEIVFVFDVSFHDPEAYWRESFVFVDGGVRNEAAWVELERFRSGREQLFPLGLTGKIDAAIPPVDSSDTSVDTSCGAATITL